MGLSRSSSLALRLLKSSEGRTSVSPINRYVFHGMFTSFSSDAPLVSASPPPPPSRQQVLAFLCAFFLRKHERGFCRPPSLPVAFELKISSLSAFRSLPQQVIFFPRPELFFFLAAFLGKRPGSPFLANPVTLSLCFFELNEIISFPPILWTPLCFPLFYYAKKHFRDCLFSSLISPPPPFLREVRGLFFFTSARAAT